GRPWFANRVRLLGDRPGAEGFPGAALGSGRDIDGLLRARAGRRSEGASVEQVEIRVGVVHRRVETAVGLRIVEPEARRSGVLAAPGAGVSDEELDREGVARRDADGRGEIQRDRVQLRVVEAARAANHARQLSGADEVRSVVVDLGAEIELDADVVA